MKRGYEWPIDEQTHVFGKTMPKTDYVKNCLEEKTDFCARILK